MGTVVFCRQFYVCQRLVDDPFPAGSRSYFVVFLYVRGVFFVVPAVFLLNTSLDLGNLFTASRLIVVAVVGGVLLVFIFGEWAGFHGIGVCRRVVICNNSACIGHLFLGFGYSRLG